MQRLTITEKTDRRPVTIQSRGAERGCRSIVNQLVNSMPKDVLLTTSYTEHREATHVRTTEEVRVKPKSSVTRKVQFTDSKKSRTHARTVHLGRDTVRGDMHFLARTVRLGMKHCPGSQTLLRPDRITCPGSQCQSNREMECCPGVDFKATKGKNFVQGV